MFQQILNYQIVPPVPLPYVLVGILVVLIIGALLLRRVLR
jgi:hypothetical protein